MEDTMTAEMPEETPVVDAPETPVEPEAETM
jgi:hypothetical protein